MNLNTQIKKFFQSFTLLIYNHPWTTIFIMMSLSVGLISQLPNIKLDTTTEGFFHEDDPVIIKYHEFQEQFGRDDLIIVALNPPDVFSWGFLKKLKEIHEEIENSVPYVKDITSMINARLTYGDGDELIVEDLLENWPKNKADMVALKERVLSNPLYKNTLISEDGKFTTITIKPNNFSSLQTENKGLAKQTEELDVLDGFDDTEDLLEQNIDNNKKNGDFLSDQEEIDLIDALHAIIEKYKSETFPIYLAGTPVVDHTVKENLQKDMMLFMLLAVLVIAILLFVLFRRVSGVLLPLLVVLLSLLSTLGFMAITGFAIKIPTQIIPSFLLAVGIGDSVHVLVIFFHHLKHGDTKKTAIVSALVHSGRAITLTSLTTAGGLLSFISSDIAPVYDLGIMAPIGVMITLVYTVVLLPALLAIIPISLKPITETHQKNKTHFVDNILKWFAKFSTSYPWHIVIVSSIFILLSIYASLNINFSFDSIGWLPAETPARKNTYKIDSELKGSFAFEVIVDSKIENFWHNPEHLKRLDTLAKDIKQFRDGNLFVGQIISITDIIKEVNQALNENQQKFYAIPNDKKLVAQELLLFENSGSEDLEDMVDSQFTKARFTIKLPALDAVEYSGFFDEIDKQFYEAFGDKVEVTLTGIVALIFRTINAMIISMAKSYVIALIIISLLMIIIVWNLKIGLVSMIPNLAPIIFTLGIMGFVGIPLDAFTLLIGSIAIGLVVDDTIHFLDNFNHYFQENNDVKQSIYHTLQTSGQAILYTSLVLSSGFFIYVCSSMKNLFNFGLLTGFTILLALFADFILLPALLTLVSRKR